LLGEVGQFLRRQIRKVDLAARYGGDEFVLILPETGKEGALHMCRKLCQQLRDQRFLANDGLNLQITASFGVATLPDDAADKAELLRQADRVMYEVKATSRNAVRGA